MIHEETYCKNPILGRLTVAPSTKGFCKQAVPSYRQILGKLGIGVSYMYPNEGPLRTLMRVRFAQAFACVTRTHNKKRAETPNIWLQKKANATKRKLMQ